MKRIAVCSVLIAVFGLGAAAGFAAGGRRETDRRNVVWRIFDNRMKDVPPGFEVEKRVGVLLGSLLDPMDLSAENRKDALDLYLRKGLLCSTQDEARSLERALAAGTPAQRLVLFRRVVDCDLEAARLAKGVLDDQERIEHFFRFETVPLEAPGQKK